MIGRAAIPPDRLGIILRDTLAVRIPDREAELRRGVSLIGGQTIPARGLGRVLRNTLASAVHLPEAVLRVCVALLSQHTQFSERALRVEACAGADRAERDQDGGQGENP